ncbi:MAG: hypothetical protein ACKVH0_13760 [Alphaproteobacteria bacterium]
MEVIVSPSVEPDPESEIGPNHSVGERPEVVQFTVRFAQRYTDRWRRFMGMVLVLEDAPTVAIGGNVLDETG